MEPQIGRNIPPGVGLCAVCRHKKVIKSAHGSLFLLCRLAAHDRRFAKYPRLPVLRCAGFAPQEREP